jgi:epoxyqueuosine reductase
VDLRAQGLTVLGIVQAPHASLPDGMASLALLGPDGKRFWDIFTAAPEYADGLPDPMDRWSLRVIGGLADDLGARAYFPFGNTPPHPFYSWAVASGRIWPSPVRLLVHAQAGLWVSFRGALGFDTALPDLPALPNPCTGCPAPCLSACPAGALGAQGYDVPRCHDWLDTGASCMTQGCLVRAVCPVSQIHDRAVAQSAYHMRQFHR